MIRDGPIILFIVASLFLSSCQPGMTDDLFYPRPEGEFRYDCTPRENDPMGYFIKICEYLNQNQIWVNRNASLRVRAIREKKSDDKDVIIVEFACCGSGDFGVIDKESGEVIAFYFGHY